MIKPRVQILIIDLGSQYTQVIRRSLRYLGFHSVILPPEESLEWTKKNKPKSLILSGGSASVYDSKAPKIPEEILSLKVPILGICYGMQWLAYVHDKNSIQATAAGKSYGPVQINFKGTKSKLFAGLQETINAWSSHGDSVKHAPKGFEITATSKEGGVNEAMENREKNLYAVQFHPEVEQTEDENIILNNFTSVICGCDKDYYPKDVIKE